MATSSVDSDLRVLGAIYADNIYSQGASITSDMFSSSTSSRLAVEKAIHRQKLRYTQNNGAAVAAATSVQYIARGAGSLVQLKAAITGVISTGGDSVTVDVQKSTAGGAFATVLSAVMTFNSASTLRTVTNATPTTTAFIAGDLIAIVVAVSGTSTQGLVVDVEIDENPS